MPIKFHFNTSPRGKKISRSRGNPIFGLIAGLIITGISIPFTLSNIDLLSNGEVTTGIVTGIVTTTRKGKTINHPKIEFMTAEGEKITFVPGSTTAIAPHRIGQSVEIIYKKDDPSTASIKDFLNMWIMPGMLMLFGLIFFVLSASTLVRERKVPINPSSVSFDFNPTPTKDGPPQNPPPPLQ